MAGLRERWEGLQPTAQDGLIAGVVTLLGLVPTLSSLGTQLGDLPRRPADALSAVLALAQTLPLVLRRRTPVLCLAIIGSAFAVHQAMGYPTTFASIGLYFSLYAVGSYLDSRRRVAATLGTAGYAVMALLLQRLGSPLRVTDFVVFYLSLVAAWLAGGLVRRWRAQEDERRGLSAQVAVGIERARIARELHDVVTHHVTAMVVQADAASFAPARVGEALAAIADTGRRALTDLRQLLRVMEATGDPSSGEDRVPALGRLEDLAEGARLSGQPISFTSLGSVADGGRREVELAAYRVVQEALTNAMKYAPGRPTTVVVNHACDHIEIEVASEAAVGRRDRRLSGGRGLDGLRRRLAVLGGELTAGPTPDGFVVRATIPTAGEERGG